MGMGSQIKSIGLFFMSAKGWLIIATSLPTAWAFIAGLMDGLSTSVVILVTMFTLAMSSMFAYWSMVGYVYASNLFGKRKELNELGE